jgi:hydroxybutyrate-dimer hydrolase
MATRVHEGVTATTARLPRRGLPVIVTHGASDGLIPEAFGSAAYVRSAQSAGRDVRYWRVANAQHFDAFLGLPALAASYLPMLPYAYQALDAMWLHLESGKPLPGDAQIQTQPRVVGPSGVAALSASDLGRMP